MQSLDGVDIFTLKTGKYYVGNGVNMPTEHPTGYVFVDRLLPDTATIKVIDPYSDMPYIFFNKQTASLWKGWNQYITNSDLAVFESACTIPSSIDLYVSQNLVEKSANTVCLTLDFHVNKAVESASIIFVLPEGFRPRQTLFVPVLDVTTNTPNTYATIEPNGNISVASNIQTGFFAIIQKTFMV